MISCSPANKHNYLCYNLNCFVLKLAQVSPDAAARSISTPVSDALNMMAFEGCKTCFFLYYMYIYIYIVKWDFYICRKGNVKERGRVEQRVLNVWTSDPACVSGSGLCGAKHPESRSPSSAVCSSSQFLFQSFAVSTEVRLREAIRSSQCLGHPNAGNLTFSPSVPMPMFLFLIPSFSLCEQF